MKGRISTGQGISMVYFPRRVHCSSYRRILPDVSTGIEVRERGQECAGGTIAARGHSRPDASQAYVMGGEVHW